MRILFLHGFTQNGELFARKASAIRKALGKLGHETFFIDAPYKVNPNTLPFEASEGIDMRSWWEYEPQSSEYFKLDKAFDTIKEAIDSHGEFDGVVGFSQGAGLAAVVAQHIKKLQPSHPDFKFCVLYAGFRLKPPFDQSFYDSKITTPTLHVLGTVDTVVSEERSMTLWEACDENTRTMLKHPGGHYVPSQKNMIEAVMSFIISNVQPDPVESSAATTANETAADDEWDEFDKIGK